ncbi:Ribonuclease H-like domain,OTU domain [Cinara cedri]|uniref:Ribonuclease H-like domain,OTU domain n=1 Tax=Cinara cedri TaxID=506608 RepID=A0A5E4NPH8_9HEMI|nr:Ribonuclease H-like domain,OTU domain [Cinara cedri]
MYRVWHVSELLFVTALNPQQNLVLLRNRDVSRAGIFAEIDFEGSNSETPKQRTTNGLSEERYDPPTSSKTVNVSIWNIDVFTSGESNGVFRIEGKKNTVQNTCTFDAFLQVLTVCFAAYITAGNTFKKWVEKKHERGIINVGHGRTQIFKCPCLSFACSLAYTFAYFEIFSRVGVDVITLPLVNKQHYVVFAVCYLTNLCIARSLEDNTAESVAQFLYEKILCKKPLSEIQISYKGRQFFNLLKIELKCWTGTKPCVTTAYGLPENGVVKSLHRTLKNTLLQDDFFNWPEILMDILKAYTHTVIVSAKYKEIFKIKCSNGKGDIKFDDNWDFDEEIFKNILNNRLKAFKKEKQSINNLSIDVVGYNHTHLQNLRPYVKCNFESEAYFDPDDNNVVNPTKHQKFIPVNKNWMKTQMKAFKINLSDSDLVCIAQTCSKPLTKPKRIIDVLGDGNCWYRCISLWVTGSEKYHDVIRAELYQYVMNNKDVLGFAGNDWHKNNEQMNKNGTWVVDVEVFATALFLKTNIYVYTKSWSWQLFGAQGMHTKEVDLINKKSIYIINCNSDHFKVVIDVN